mmetsp:Transcript_20771/g.47141  ORF Transcript_20771/g.47141 Transcript_20771/m.47141 type:complete len:529 (-) Transcript_20771:198-1784(-)
MKVIAASLLPITWLLSSASEVSGSFEKRRSDRAALRRTQTNDVDLPHQGCEGLLNDLEEPHEKSVGEEWASNHPLSLYDYENEQGKSSAECIDGFAGGYPCNGVNLLSMLSLNELNAAFTSSVNTSGNDVWGWTYDKREFALMGLGGGTAFVEITDPYEPKYLGVLETAGNKYGSNWRDIKIYKNYALIVSENSGHGMQIFDLKQLLTASAGNNVWSESARYTEIGQCHNVFVNEDTGFAYTVGTRSRSLGGLNIVDINDPLNPSFAGGYSGDGYTHDVQCVIYNGPDTPYLGREICFASNEDTVTIIDVTDKSDIKQISKKGYPGARYTHQGWLTEDHEHFIFNDELDNYSVATKTKTHILGVESLGNPTYVGFYEGLSNAIDHNIYIKGQYLYQANYRAGLRVLEVNLPNLKEVAYFDIYPNNNDNNFNGAWSVYPYFDSGTVLISGIEQGLFMVKVKLPNERCVDTRTKFKKGPKKARGCFFLRKNERRRAKFCPTERFKMGTKEKVQICSICCKTCKDYCTSSS